jgi:APA family basic amino acid/polyamine antiporter
MEGATQPASRLDTIVAQARSDRSKLDSTALGPFSLTTLGVASVVGAGIFVTTGEAAARYAGPAVVFSFLLAGLAAAFTALCYAEIASMIPIAGSTYSYAYAAFGVFVAWFIGWDLLLEYLFAASTVAVGWSGYFVTMLESIGITIPHSLANPPFGSNSGAINLPAVAVVFATCALLYYGTKESARTNNWLVVIKVSVLVLFVVVGAFHIDTANWDPFFPPKQGSFGDYGIGGILRGAGLVFFAYVGFDAVSTAAAESRDPKRTVPLGLLATVAISTLLYVAIGLVMTGMDDYHSLNVADPLSAAVKSVGGLAWLESLVNVAAVVGLFGTVLVTFYGQTRILMRMSRDGMLPDAFGRISEKTKTPKFTTGLCAVAGAAVAGLMPIDALGDLVSIGTLFAFLIVCTGVLVLRRTHPHIERPFRVPHVKIVAPLGILSALALMVTLPVSTWIRLVVWLLIGLVIFFLYARRHTEERFAELEREGGLAAAATSPDE